MAMLMADAIVETKEIDANHIHKVWPSVRLITTNVHRRGGRFLRFAEAMDCWVEVDPDAGCMFVFRMLIKNHARRNRDMSSRASR
mmetsp:Transcript_23598/g.65906  ORF Transcript_23598/g.65906 Transcript_23598/m.65906 type:complete len:85 (+) Transcript_23598:2-256(+)